MAFAVQSDVQERLGRDLTSTELSTVDASLDDATDLVIGYCRTDFDDEPPSAVVRVVAGMVARSIRASSTSVDPFAERVASGPFSIARGAAASSGDVWLTAGDKVKLRPHRVNGGMASAQLVGERYTIDEDA